MNSWRTFLVFCVTILFKGSFGQINNKIKGDEGLKNNQGDSVSLHTLPLSTITVRPSATTPLYRPSRQSRKAFQNGDSFFDLKSLAATPVRRKPDNNAETRSPPLPHNATKKTTLQPMLTPLRGKNFSTFTKIEKAINPQEFTKFMRPPVNQLPNSRTVTVSPDAQRTTYAGHRQLQPYQIEFQTRPQTENPKELLLRCYSCKADFRHGSYEMGNPCLGRHGHNISADYMVACGPSDEYCMVERTEVNRVLTHLIRQCTDTCYYGCRPKGFGINFETCSNCCNTSGCNSFYPSSLASSFDSSFLIILFTLSANCAKLLMIGNSIA